MDGAIQNGELNPFRSEFLDLGDFVHLVAKVAKLTVSRSGNPGEVSTKSDGTPVGEVDLQNHKLLSAGLPELLKAPVFSEENYPEFNERKTARTYWLIDPLDGTKEFLKGIGEYSVLVSLMVDGRPHFAAIAIPPEDKIFVAEKGKGAHLRVREQWVKPQRNVSSKRVGVVSRFAAEPEVLAFYQQHRVVETRPIGSALKFCAIATGDAEIYYRHYGPHEWDVAAGDLIINESGGSMLSKSSNSAILYNGESSRVGAFLALAPGFVL